MKKTMNKKGFTLVELLAVIVILAVIILVAMNAVIPQMEKNRKSAFVTEAETYINAAKTWYTAESMKGTQKNCVNVTALTNEFVEKTGGDDYKGNVQISYDATTKKTTYTISISNGKYMISGKTLEELATGGETLVTDSTATAADCS